MRCLSLEFSFPEYLPPRHRRPGCLLPSRVDYLTWTNVIYQNFLHVVFIRSLCNYIRVFNVEETESAFRNAFFTSVALTVSTFIYGRTPAGLSLLDGLIVTFLPYVITVGGAYNALTVLMQGKATLKFAYALHIIMCVAFGLTVWVHIDTYGATPGCNLNSSVKFVVFGHSVVATSRALRGFGIFVFAFIAVFLPFILISLISQSSPPQGPTFGDDVWIWTFGGCMAWVYEVVTIEEIIRRNGVGHATSQWTYGQTFAVLLVLGPVFDFGSAMWRRLEGNREQSCPRCSLKPAGN